MAVLTRRVVLKYILIHLAELVVVGAALVVLVYVIDLAVWLAVTILVLWIAKDVAVFPKVWKAYATDETDPLRKFIGVEATVVYALDPVGYVRVNGELWRAESRDAGQRVEKGAVVTVVDIRGMTLIVVSRHGGDR